MDKYEALYRALHEGKTVAEIAPTLGVSTNRIYGMIKTLRKHGVPIPKKDPARRFARLIELQKQLSCEALFKGKDDVDQQHKEC